MSAAKSISEAEWDVMKVVWDQPGQTANEIGDALSGKRDWSPRTVKTLISRLVKKGALRFEADGPRYHYYPDIAREEAVREEAKSFAARVFDGMSLPMLSHFVKSSRLSESEIASLKRLLDEQTDSEQKP